MRSPGDDGWFLECVGQSRKEGTRRIGSNGRPQSHFRLKGLEIINYGFIPKGRLRVTSSHRAPTCPMRLAYLPAEKAPVVFGVHSEVAEHYKVPPNAYPPHATTLDYVVAAAAG